MGNSSFLDKGLLLGFCFTVDVHHVKCRQYLDNPGLDFYITEEVERAFNDNKKRMVEDHRKELLKHVQRLEKSDFNGRLGPMELQSIRDDLITKRSYPNSWRYLRDYYDELNIISVREIQEELREIARQIEAQAEERRQEFTGFIHIWERADEYPGVEDNLEEIRVAKAEDFWICIDAHDLAVRTDGQTELATTDLNDFIRGGRRDLILDSTEIDSIEEVAVAS